MFDKQILLLYVLFISISAASVGAEESHKESYQEKKLEAGTPFDASQKTQPLNLTVDPDIIEESKEQQSTINKKSNQLLPNVFKDQQAEKAVSMEGGILMKNEAITSEAVDGAEISIKVKTD